MLLKGIRKGEKKELIKTKIVLIKLFPLSLIPELKLLAILLIILATRKDTYPGIKSALNMQIKSGITATLITGSRLLSFSKHGHN